MPMILRETSRTFSRRLLFSLVSVRSMGGGPRTFPGGLNKWQWKRLHEKKAREKEKRLLDQEKQLYQARLRSQIRATVSGQTEPDPSPTHTHTHTPTPMSPKDHIKALADRFIKPGAEDLWNENDGPIHSPPPKTVDSPIDLKKLIKNGNSVNSNFLQKRGFSMFNRRNDFGDEEYCRTLADLRGVCSNLQQRRGYSFNTMSTFKMRFENQRKIDLRKLIKDGNLANSNLLQKRGFSVFNRRNDDGDEECCRTSSDMRGFGSNLQQRRGYSFSTMSTFKMRFENQRNDYGNSSNLRDFGGRLQRKRVFSTNVGKFKKKFSNRRYKDASSEDDEEDDYGKVTENARWPRFTVEGDGKESKEERDTGGGKGVRGFMGNASLGKYDVKTTKRRILKDLEDYAEIEEIRQAVSERKLVEKSPEKSDQDEFVASGKRFEDCGVSPLTVKALTSAGYIQMSRVQEATLSIGLEGKDALVKGRAGTGKTAAFLLPAIETVLKAISSNKVQRVPPIYVLILCPTRELASQIAAETRVLIKYHDGLGVQMLVGGTRFKDDQKRIESDPCQILVATPGRLLDHIEARSGLSTRLMGLKVLVLDEADHLLDLGFRKDLEKIVDCLPRRRQSLLFSATVPKEVRRISQLVLKREHAFINCMNEGSPDTNSKVKQSYIIAPHDQHFQVVHQLLKAHISGMPDYKVIIFCTTGMVTSLMYLVFREMRLNVREIHSRKPQLYRSRVSDEFKQSKRLILISSDVSARGLNYPDVTLIIQVGIPSDREQYIHRLGRTGREGKDGEGILLLAPWEEHFLEDIRDLPVERSSTPHIDRDMKAKMEESMGKIDTSVKEAAYHAWLGYYNSIRETGRDKTSLVQWANQFCESIGLEKPPALFRKTVIKMGLKDIPGIRIRK